MHKHSDRDVKIFWAGSKQVASITLPRSQKQGESSPQKLGKNEGTVNLLHLSTTNSSLQKAFWLPLRILQKMHAWEWKSRPLYSVWIWVFSASLKSLQDFIKTFTRRDARIEVLEEELLTVWMLDWWNKLNLRPFSGSKAGSSGWRDHGSVPCVWENHQLLPKLPNVKSKLMALPNHFYKLCHRFQKEAVMSCHNFLLELFALRGFMSFSSHT